MWKFALTVLAGCAGDPAHETNEDPSGNEPCRAGEVGSDCEEPEEADLDGDGFVAKADGGDDCDDGDATVHPGALEVPYDGIDQDCDGTDLLDVDGDGWGSGDCDDANPEIHPDAGEAWYDGIDQDCAYDCDYDADGDRAVPAEWLPEITDGSACDRAPDAEIFARTDCDDGDPEASSQRIEYVAPEDGAVDVDVYATVFVLLHDNEPAASVRLLDPSGAEVPSESWHEDADELSLYPSDGSGSIGDVALAGLTTFTIEVTHSCGIETRTFTTGPGDAPLTPESVVGRTWSLTPLGMSWVDFGVTEYLWFGTSMGLISVVGTDGVDLDLRIAATDSNGNQNACVPTADIHGVDFSENPTFSFESSDYPLGFEGLNGPIAVVHQQGGLRATIRRDELLEATVSGFVDTRVVDAAAGLAPGTICSQWTCIACPDGSGNTCIEEEIAMGDGMIEVGVTLVSRTAAEIAADPTCP